MPDEPINGREPDKSEAIQREKLGPRGVPGKESPAQEDAAARKENAKRGRSRPYRVT